MEFRPLSKFGRGRGGDGSRAVIAVNELEFILPDGSKKVHPVGVTGREIAEAIRFRSGQGCGGSAG
jgi:hypothetical protein